jgi:hypothetical protein
VFSFLSSQVITAVRVQHRDCREAVIAERQGRAEWTTYRDCVLKRCESRSNSLLPTCSGANAGHHKLGCGGMKAVGVSRRLNAKLAASGQFHRLGGRIDLCSSNGDLRRSRNPHLHPISLDGEDFDFDPRLDPDPLTNLPAEN